MTTERTIEIPQPDLRDLEVVIRGRTPLITHNGESAVALIEERQSRDAKLAKGARDPEAEFRASLYVIEDGRYGFPAAGVKLAVVNAGMRFADEKATVLRGAIQILADLLEITGGDPYMRRDRVVLARKTTSVAYRACFPTWQMRVPVVYNAAVLGESQVVNLLALAGFSIGIGDWRPEKNGTFGQFEVVEARA